MGNNTATVEPETVPSMLACRFQIVGTAPISFGRAFQSTRADKETHEKFEERCWREKMHLDDNGQVYIPPTALKKCLDQAAAYRSEKIPSQGAKKWTGKFLAGTMVTEPLMLNVAVDDVESERHFVSSTGKPGSGSRVWRIFPVIKDWKTEACIYLLDPLLIQYPEKVQDYLVTAGRFVGLGRFAPRNGGFFGRFNVEGFTTEPVA